MTTIPCAVLGFRASIVALRRQGQTRSDGTRIAIYFDMINTHVSFSLSIVAVSFAAALPACSSDTASKGPSGLDSSREIAELSSDEVSALCDWSLETEGGAGNETQCEGNTAMVVHTKAQCMDDMTMISKLSSCAKVTVDEIEKCSIETGKAPCEEAPTCAMLNERLEKCASK